MKVKISKNLRVIMQSGTLKIHCPLIKNIWIICMEMLMILRIMVGIGNLLIKIIIHVLHHKVVSKIIGNNGKNIIGELKSKEIIKVIHNLEHLHQTEQEVKMDGGEDGMMLKTKIFKMMLGGIKILGIQEKILKNMIKGLFHLLLSQSHQPTTS